MTVTVATVATVTVAITGSVGVTTLRRDIRQHDLYLLGIIDHFGDLLEGLFAERFIGLQTADHEQAHIAILDDCIGIWHQTNRRTIHHDIVILLAHLIDHVSQFIGMYQLTRVRRDVTGTHEVKTKRRITRDDILELAIADQIVRHTVTVLET